MRGPGCDPSRPFRVAPNAVNRLLNRAPHVNEPTLPSSFCICEPFLERLAVVTSSSMRMSRVAARGLSNERHNGGPDHRTGLSPIPCRAVTRLSALYQLDEKGVLSLTVSRLLLSR